MKDGSILNVKEAARTLNVSVLTVKNYIYQGKLKSFKTPGGHHRILRADLYAIIKKAHFFPEHVEFLDSLVTALEIRDSFTQGHSSRVAEYALSISRELNLSRARLLNIRLAALLHDIGKICIDESILKKSNRLTEGELSIMRSHSIMGERILEPVEAFRAVRPLIKHHHERYDGNGYPHRLAKEKIPLGARIISVAESYDSMLSGSSYRNKLSKKETIRELEKGKARQFDPEIVDVFIKTIK